jgi:hypothetical protein
MKIFSAGPEPARTGLWFVGQKVNVRHERSLVKVPYDGCTDPGANWIGPSFHCCATLILPMDANPNSEPSPDAIPDASTRLRGLSGATLIVALLQSICTAVLTISGIRVAIGLSALAAASGVYAPARGFHQDAIRIPMLSLAAAGAIVNLAVLAWIWRLRSRPSAQWRRQPLNPRQKRSERLQVILSVVTLILVGLEVWTHPMVHRTSPPPADVHSTGS